MREVADASEKQARDRAFVQDFVNFVRREDARLLPAMDAILATDTLGDAAKLLGITEWRFAGTCTRLRELGKCFLTGEPTPRKRRTYKKRKRLNLAAIPKKTETPPTPSAASSLCINLCTEFEGFQQFLPLPLPCAPFRGQSNVLGDFLRGLRKWLLQKGLLSRRVRLHTFSEHPRSHPLRHLCCTYFQVLGSPP